MRGAIHRVDLGDAKRGHEQRGRRYGLIVSEGPAGWSMVTLIPTSTSAQSAVFRPEIDLLGTTTLLLVDQIRSVDLSFIQPRPVAFLDRVDMAKVDTAMAKYLALV